MNRFIIRSAGVYHADRKCFMQRTHKKTTLLQVVLLELIPRFELGTSSLPRMRSTG